MITKISHTYRKGKIYNIHDLNIPKEYYNEYFEQAAIDAETGKNMEDLKDHEKIKAYEDVELDRCKKSFCVTVSIKDL